MNFEMLCFWFLPTSRSVPFSHARSCLSIHPFFTADTRERIPDEYHIPIVSQGQEPSGWMRGNSAGTLRLERSSSELEPCIHWVFWRLSTPVRMLQRTLSRTALRIPVSPSHAMRTRRSPLDIPAPDPDLDKPPPRS